MTGPGHTEPYGPEQGVQGEQIKLNSDIMVIHQLTSGEIKVLNIKYKNHYKKM